MKWRPTHTLAIAWLLLCSTASAQVQMRLSADRDKILIGEKINLSVDAYVPLGADVRWPAFDSIPHFLITVRSAVDTSQNVDGKKIGQVITVTSFDSGRWTIPAIQVYVDNKPYLSDSLTVDVGFVSFDPKDDYHDIRDIVSIEQPVLRYVPWLIAAACVLSLAGIYLLTRKRRKPAEAAELPRRRQTAYELAVRAIADLKKKGVVAGDEKAYYSELNDILRRFVAGQFSVPTFERTNEELIAQLSVLGLPEKHFNGLAQSLRIADFVKFARYRPSEDDNARNLETVRSSIDILYNYSGSAV